MRGRFWGNYFVFLFLGRFACMRWLDCSDLSDFLDFEAPAFAWG